MLSPRFAEFGKCNPASTSGQGARLKIVNNLFYNVKGNFLQLNGFNDLTVQNNLHLQAGNTIMFFGRQTSERFVYRDNVTIEKPYGVRDEQGTSGIAALEKMAPAAVFVGNIMGRPPLGSESWYFPMPPGNEYPESLPISSDFRTSYAGKGVNIDLLRAAQSGVVNPDPTPTPTPSPTPTPTVTPSPSPSPTVMPSPSPSPTPTPSPTPPACSISAPNAVEVGRWAAGVINVTVTNPQAMVIKGTALSGQVSVLPRERSVTPTSSIVPFQISVKNNSSAVRFDSACGSKTVIVNVR